MSGETKAQDRTDGIGAGVAGESLPGPAAGAAPMPKQLLAPVDSLSGLGPKRAALLANLGIETVGDLVFYFPRGYEDRRKLSRLADLREGDTATVEAEIVRARAIRLRRRLSLAEVTIKDDSGQFKAIWFGRDYLARAFSAGSRALFSGTVGKWNGLALRNPDYELLSGDEADRLHTGRIVPVYRLTDGVTQRMLRNWIRSALDALDEPLPETLPPALAARYDFPPADGALRQAHFPDEVDAARAARNRFAYEELLRLQVGILHARAARLHEETGTRHVVDGPFLGALRASLPFHLTPGQDRAVADILEDMASPRPMVRLIQGDVGSGKTVVGLHAIAAAADGGYQTALMAPTEILAEQHGLSLREMLAPLGLDIEVLTGSTPDAPAVRERVAHGEAHVVVGTHALIQESTSFHRLGLAIIDEQHRFGVLQRGALIEKGLNPDLIHMTATPIPRTLAITVYGGMDISVIEEMPPGRSPVVTSRITPAKVPGLHDTIRRRAAAGQQTFVVCPLVEDSAKVDLTSVTSHYRELSAGPLAGLRVGLLHGRMASDEKDAVMHAFKRGELDVLFCTTVIEVGIDCPNATTIVIEDAPQFGLTQLHQLRGRVGRGTEQSYCYLLGKHKTPEGKRRLEVMCATSSGFDVAEADLELRGPGESYGVRQAGLSDLRFADLIRDVRLLDAARRDALEILDTDPGLTAPEHALLAAGVRGAAPSG
ncbi:MAG: ATP-dependent DNA helicase RecG [Candidatus Hydrogenedentes bacterium]|nr:ATP-dependent DNA helicase RecG [Candidatus Hydrogenedentota bacterium]